MINKNIECPAYTDLRKGDEIIVTTIDNDKTEHIVVESSEVDDEEVHISFRYAGIVQNISFDKELHKERCFGVVMLDSPDGKIYRRIYTSVNAILIEESEQKNTEQKKYKHNVDLDRYTYWLLTDPLLRWCMRYL